jgi:hypothetical protein
MAAVVNLIWAVGVVDGSRLWVEIDGVMRHKRCSDDESDSYPRIGYQHFICPSWACLGLYSRISLAGPPKED